MRVLYLDFSAGVSGDMLLGALADLGVPRDVFEETVRALRTAARLSFSEASRGGIRGLRAEVATGSGARTSRLGEFLEVLDRSRLDADVGERAAQLLRRVFEAEGRVHGRAAEEVHLHELGSLDTLVDVVGVVAAVHHLAPDQVAASPVNVGSGSVEAEHGTLEVPAPATALLLTGIPSFSDGSGFERTTPTGALLASLAASFEGWPAFVPERFGYGLGSADPRSGRPNALRAVLGRTGSPAGERVAVLEATLDDMQPELLPHLLDRLLEGGARDAWSAPAAMKKGRGGSVVTAIADPEDRDRVIAVFFRESTTLGVRITEAERRILERRVVQVVTPWGEVGMKLGLFGGRVVNRAPEFEACRRLAAASGAPLKEVYREALAAPLPPGIAAP